jgi:hypothetical protein
MTLDLTDDEARALARHLRDALDYARYPFAPRLDPLKSVLAAVEGWRSAEGRTRLTPLIWRTCWTGWTGLLHGKIRGLWSMRPKFRPTPPRMRRPYKRWRYAKLQQQLDGRRRQR